MNKRTFVNVMLAVLVLFSLILRVDFVRAEPPVTQDSIYRPNMQELMNYNNQAAEKRAATDPMFQKVLSTIDKAPNSGTPMAAQAAKKPQATAVPVACNPAAYVYPFPCNVAPPHFYPGLGFNPAVNYDLPNYSQSPNIRKFVDKLPGLGGAGCALGTAGAVPPYSDGTCNQNELGQYIPVAIPDRTTYPDADYYEISGGNYSLKMSSDLPVTALRGYAQTNTVDPSIGNVHQYLGPMIVARVFDPTQPYGTGLVGSNGRPVRIKFTNNLPISTNPASKIGLPVDTTLMGAGYGPLTPGGAVCDMGTAAPGTCAMYTENRLSILHLHGGRTPWISDGTPHQWFTPAGDPTVLKKGASFQNVPDMIGPGKTIPAPTPGDGMVTQYWSNQQSPRLMFYHDHALGITRLNVYKGLAAPYLLVSQVEDDLIDGTNTSTGNPLATQILPNLGGVYRYGIPLVIQDKAFVNDATTPPGPGFPLSAPHAAGTPAIAPGYDPTFKTLDVDPLWATYAGTPGGSLWMSHEYLPVENIFDTVGGATWPAGNTTNGRWDYGPFLIPPGIPLYLTIPSPTLTPEAFADTAVINGTAFPYIPLPAEAVRFRILSVGNDRVFNLQLYFAMDKNGAMCKMGGPAFDAASCTEVSMVPAAPQPAPYQSWPKDGRDGGVPDPTKQGPHWLEIGNEGGFLAQVADIPAQPLDYEYNRQNIPPEGATSHSLLMLPAQRSDVIVDFTGYAPGDVLILYNDAGAPFPSFWPLNDYYTNDPDQRIVGGPTPTAPGFGPNTRTLAQIRIVAPITGFVFSKANLVSALPHAFAVAEDKPIVPQLAYNLAFPGFATQDIYVQAPDSTLNITGVGQPLLKIKTIGSGNNYTVAPTVNIIGDGIGAAATAGLLPCGGLTLLTAGTGYTTAPTCTIGAPGAGGVTATCVATVSGGTVNALTIDEPGSNYSITTPATCTITGGGGTGATCSTFVAVTGTMGSITLTSPGSGYTQEPRVYITPNSNSGQAASAIALLSGAVVMTGKSITEGFDVEYGRLDIKMGSTPNPLTPTVGNGFILGAARYIDPPTELVNSGEVTLWRLSHLGVDSHALHFHLFDVQVVNRVDWTNVVKPPYPEELGWRDTIRTNPMEDIVVAFRPHPPLLPFALPVSMRLLDPSTPVNSVTNFYPVAPPAGIAVVPQVMNVLTNFNLEYVFHCHMLEHEENDFMRSLDLQDTSVKPAAPTGLLVTGAGTGHANLTWTDPTPVSSITTLGNPQNEIGFLIQRCSGAACTTFATVGTVGANATAFTDASATLSATYRYQVLAYNAAGNGPASNIVSVALTIPVPTLVVAPATIGSGGTVTVTFNNVNGPTTVDWIGVFTPIGAANSAYSTWVYDSSCTQIAGGTAKASGSCQFTMGGILPTGSYQFRLFSNNGMTLLASSNTLTVTNAVAITAAPTPIVRPGVETGTFTGVVSPTSLDWIGLYLVGAANASYLDWVYDSSCTQIGGTARAAGSCPINITTFLAAGTYELRLFSNNSFSLLGKSNPITVQ